MTPKPEHDVRVGAGAQEAPAIQAQGLTKFFGSIRAVERVDFEVSTGQIFGFLGPNGAGKTTTINMLTGLARPSQGAILFLGRDYTRHIKKAQGLMGVVPDESNIYPELNGFDNLCFSASLYGIRRREREARARELLDEFGLSEASGRKAATYSKGMKRKLTIAAGIIHRPPILFLDEPTTGIDVASARQIRQMILDLNRSGTTIFLTTHYIEEAERLCHRIAFIVEGRIIRADTMERLVEDVQGKEIVQLAVDRSIRHLLTSLRSQFPAAEFECPSDVTMRVTTAGSAALGPFIRFFEEQGVQVHEARKVRPSLEEVFIRVTGVEAERLRKEKGGGAQ